jgi:hypothetical protein
MSRSDQATVGTRTDTHTSDSLYGRVKTLVRHAHSPSKVYPTLANGVTLTAGAAWTLGVFAEIVPVSTITSDFDIHHISIEGLSAVEVYEIVLYAATVEIGRVRVTKAAQLEGTQDIDFQTDLIPANTQIQGKVATEGGSDTATISIKYHTY